jgi:hypothetical protein
MNTQFMNDYDATGGEQGWIMKNGMNERILELAEQAAYGVVDPNGPFTAEEFVNFQQKFAELIVRKCADVVYSRSGHATPQDLYEHFGVGE